MVKALVGIGLATKHMEIAVIVTTVELITRPNVRPTAESPLKDGSYTSFIQIPMTIWVAYDMPLFLEMFN